MARHKQTSQFSSTSLAVIGVVAVIAVGAILYANPAFLDGIFQPPGNSCPTGQSYVNGQCVPINTPPPTVTANFIVTTNGAIATAKNSAGATVHSGADAATVIQSTLDGLTAGRATKEKVALVGDFIIDKKISIPSYTILETQGSIKLAPGVITNMIEARDKQFIEIRGGVIDGNKANAPTGTAGQLYSGQGGLFMFGLADSVISGVEVHDVEGNAIFVRDGKRNIIENNHVHHNGLGRVTGEGWGIIVDYAYRGPYETTTFDQKIRNNNVHDNGSHGIGVASGWVEISGNTLSNNGPNGNGNIDIETEDHDAHAVITNNKLTGVVGINIYRSPYVVVENNELTGAGTTEKPHQMRVTSSNYITIKNNTIKNAGMNPIVFVGTSNSVIENNKIDGFGSAGAGAYTPGPAGILITNVPGYDSPSNNNTIKGNEVKNGQGYGIRINVNNNNNDVINNIASGNTLGQISIANPAQQGTISGNTGYP